MTQTGSFEIVDALPKELDLALLHAAELTSTLNGRVAEFLRSEGTFRVTVPHTGRFVLMEPDNTYPGNLAYRNTGRNSARLSLTFDPANDPEQFRNVVDSAFTTERTAICTSRNIQQGVEMESGVCVFRIVDEMP